MSSIIWYHQYNRSKLSAITWHSITFYNYKYVNERKCSINTRLPVAKRNSAGKEKNIFIQRQLIFSLSDLNSRSNNKAQSFSKGSETNAISRQKDCFKKLTARRIFKRQCRCNILCTESKNCFGAKLLSSKLFK